MSKYPQIDVSKLKRYSASERASKVEQTAFAQPGAVKLSEFWRCVPDLLKARDMQDLLSACVQPVNWANLSLSAWAGTLSNAVWHRLLIDLMKLDAIQGIAANGSVVIHDWEIGMQGKTSEDVAEALTDGSFGMAADTADGINAAIKQAQTDNLGLGEAVGKVLSESAPHRLIHYWQTLICTAFPSPCTWQWGQTSFIPIPPVMALP